MNALPSLGIDFAFGFFDLPASDRIRAIRDAGFDDVMLWWGDEFAETNGAKERLFDLALANGLNVRTAHFPTADTPALWTPGEAGDQYLHQLITALRECGERDIAHLVVHTTKKLITPPPCAIGAARMRAAAAEAERNQVDIALENTRFLQYNQYLYDGVPSERMKYCFDCGHAHCFTPDQDPLERFGDKLVTMHLHDNHGPASGDEHLLPGEGDIDFTQLAQRLRALRPSAYNIESRRPAGGDETPRAMTEYLARAHRALCAIARARREKTA